MHSRNCFFGRVHWRRLERPPVQMIPLPEQYAFRYARDCCIFQVVLIASALRAPAPVLIKTLRAPAHNKLKAISFQFLLLAFGCAPNALMRLTFSLMDKLSAPDVCVCVCVSKVKAAYLFC